MLSTSAGGQERTSIGPRFHEETGFGPGGIKNDNLGWGQKIPLFKTYPEAEKIKLPEPKKPSGSVSAAIQNRHSVRSFSDSTMTLADLSRLLLSGYGLTGIRSGTAHRTVPSGGALYPLEIYLVVSNVESLEPGLYHFQVSDSSLEFLRRGDFSDEIHEAANNQQSAGSSPVTLVIAARFERMTVKYADRGYRYVYIEAGAVMENIYLQGAEIGAATVAVGAFNDDLLNRFLGIDGVAEAALLVMPVGYPR
jgi:SagB-type dehydrogenase family enzyme